MPRIQNGLAPSAKRELTHQLFGRNDRVIPLDVLIESTFHAELASQTSGPEAPFRSGALIELPVCTTLGGHLFSIVADKSFADGKLYDGMMNECEKLPSGAGLLAAGQDHAPPPIRDPTASHKTVSQACAAQLLNSLRSSFALPSPGP
jgi:hypothetical protein